MNVQQLHNRVKFYLDQVRSPRFEVSQIDDALNAEQENIIEDRYGNIHIKKDYSFETVQRVRDELRTLVAIANPVPVNNVITMPADYLHELTLVATISGEEQASRAISYNEYKEINKNSFTQPDNEDNVYHIESENGIEVLFGDGTLDSVELVYLRLPLTISFTGDQTSELPEILHDVLAAKAASILLNTVNNFDKGSVMERESSSS